MRLPARQTKHESKSTQIVIWAGEFEQNKAIVDSFCQRVTMDKLAEIARADNGMDFVAYLYAVRQLRNRQNSSLRMLWKPKEALELFRWSEFGDNRKGQELRS